MDSLPFSRIVLFLAVVVTLSAGMHVYVGARMAAVFATGSSAAKFVRPVFGVLFFLLIASMFLSRVAAPSLPVRVAVVGGLVWMGLLFLLLVATLSGDLVAGALSLLARLFGQDPSGWSRAVRGVLLALAPLAAIHGIVQALRPPLVREVEVRITGLAPAWDGIRVAHITDTHVGPILGRTWVEDLVRRVDSAKPDLVVHTGDLVDGSVEDLRDALEPFARIKGPLGTFFVTGNHEGYSGVAAWSRQMRAWGWDVLSNEHRILERDGAPLAIAGVPDAHEGLMKGGAAPDIEAALRGLPSGVPVVLLAHQPRQAFSAKGRGVSLQLSGHTHGGQIWPFHYLVRLQQPLVAGFARIGDVPVFTSRGAGFWGPPLRIGARAEVPILVLRAI